MPTGIEWTDETWNPVTGCDKVSQGCRHCYAERMAKRLAGRFGYPEAPNQFDVTLHKDRLTEPLNWRKPRKVFVCSMSDLFHPEVPFEFIAAVFAVISKSKDHTFQILTKRPARMRDFFEWAEFGMVDKWARAHTCWLNGMYEWAPKILDPWPPRNAWLGVSVENQEKADERIPILLRTPAVIRFVSAEPLLGAIDFDTWVNIVGGPTWLDQLDWVIAGGESGPGARPLHPDWARSIKDQCVAADVPLFFKQWGAWRPQKEGEDISDKTYKTVRPTQEARVGQNGTPNAWMVKVGKGEAGRELDGETFKQYPETYQEVDPVEETQIIIDHYLDN